MKILSKLLDKKKRGPHKPTEAKPANAGKARVRQAGVKGGVYGDTPGHIAFIMDGNGRWAKRRGLARTVGHSFASKNFEALIDYLLENGAHTVTLWGFSTENWNRPKAEVDFLMKLMTSEAKRFRQSAIDRNIRVKVIGRRDRIPTALLDAIEEIEMETFAGDRGTVCFAIDYGGQDEILRAARDMLSENMTPEKLTEEIFNSYLDSGELAPIDLLVRTSGEQRISNFMLWKGAYAEIAFIPEMWPDMTPKVMARVLKDYNARDRRFGGLKNE
ncbi:MAG: di-trans,poly-cis-decaprenylcistransferase [Rickettsiales bacterium]|jgi:undecaprenyl diphosphate synthase|nr:di-trans,poly-cis-decaprenylcistransferase [Rickettsiales bacterium]